MPHSTSHSALRALCLLCAAWLLAGAAQAATLLNITAPAPLSGFINQQILVTSWTQTHAWSNVNISAPLMDGRPGGPHAGVQGTVYLVTQTGPGTTAAHNAAPPASISGLTDTFAATPLWTGLTLPAGTYHLIFVSATNDPMSLSPAMSGTASPPDNDTGPGVAALHSFPQLNNVALLNTAFPPASPFTAAGDYPSHLLVRVTGDIGALPDPQQPGATPVPTLGNAALALLVALLGAAGCAVRRQKA